MKKILVQRDTKCSVCKEEIPKGETAFTEESESIICSDCYEYDS